jgi:hypothetical protein
MTSTTIKIIYWALFLILLGIFTAKFIRNLRRLKKGEIDSNRLMTTTAGDIAVLILWLIIFIIRWYPGFL